MEQEAITQQVAQVVDDTTKDFAFLATISALGLDALVNWRVAAQFLGVTTRQAIQTKVTSGALERRSGLYRIGDVQSYISGTGEDLDRGIELVRKIAQLKIRNTDKRRLMQDLRAAGITLTDLYTLGRINRCIKKA